MSQLGSTSSPSAIAAAMGAGMPRNAATAAPVIDAVFLTPAEVRRNIARVGKTTLYKWIRTGAFPAPYRLGRSRVGFKRTEIEAWVNSRERITNLVDLDTGE